jgi:hypothetical protein
MLIWCFSSFTPKLRLNPLLSLVQLSLAGREQECEAKERKKKMFGCLIEKEKTQD